MARSALHPLVMAAQFAQAGAWIVVGYGLFSLAGLLPANFPASPWWADVALIVVGLVIVDQLGKV